MNKKYFSNRTGYLFNMKLKGTIKSFFLLLALVMFSGLVNAQTDTVYTFNDGVLPDGFGAYTSGTKFGQTTSANEWEVVQEDSSFEGGFSLKSGSILASENSNMGFYVRIAQAGGTLKFKYYTSTEDINDKFKLEIKGVLTDSLSGFNDWTDSPEYTLPGGEYWVDLWYSKNGSIDSGLDAVYIDSIAISGIVERVAITSISSNSGAPGSNLTIYGTGFVPNTSDNTVTIGSTEATILSATETRLVVEVPNETAGLADISVSNFKTSVEYSGDFTVLEQNAGGVSFGDANSVSSTSLNARSVSTADIDGDGDLDIVAASADDNTIAWFENQGLGTFAAESIIADTLTSAWDILTADLDDDGDVDILATARDGDEIILFYNDSIGGFESVVISNTQDGPVSVFTADLDNDGYLDILSASEFDDTIAWYQNNGGGFENAVTITTLANGATDVIATDIDNDGDLDVVSASILDDKIAYYLNDGTGQFGGQFILTSSADSASSVIAADLNDDGYPEIITTSIADNKISIHANNSGSLSATQNVISTSSEKPTQVRAGDIDGDGDLDLVVSSRADDKIVWFQNDGTGSFSDPIIFATNSEQVAGVHLADLYGDGDLDVLAAAAGINEIEFFENGGYPIIDVTSVYPTTVAPGSYMTIYGTGFSLSANDQVFFGSIPATVTDGGSDFIVVEVPDISSGAVDIKVQNGGNSDTENVQLKVLENTTPYLKASTKAFEGLLNSSSDFGDVDGDGDLDLLIQGQNNSSEYYTKLFLNDGSENFTDSGVSLTKYSDGTSKLVDLDGDGDLDIFVNGYNGPGATYSSSIYLNNGSGGFVQLGTAVIGTAQGRTTFGDVDGDDDIDILVTGTSSSTYNTVLYLNNGSASFTNSGQSFGALNYSSAEMADIDLDGDLDIFISGYTPSYFARLYLNNGSGSFTNSGESFTGLIYSDIAIGDIDGDAYPDIIYTGHNGSVLTTLIYFNNGGDGSFTASGQSLQGGSYGTVELGDVDGDGDYDLLMTGSGYAIVYENDGNGTFANSGLSIKGVSNGSGKFIDIDDDNDLDVFVTGTHGNYTSILYENIEQPFYISRIEPEFANAGSKVTIYGSGFTSNASNNSVTIGGQSASVAYGSETLLQVTVPEIEEGYAEVSISNSNGSSTYQGLFSVLDAKDPYVKNSGEEFEGLRYSALGLADIDGDGDLDYLTTGQNSSGEVSTKLYRNLGDNEYSEFVQSLPDIRSGHVQFSDVDLDEDMDVVMTGYTGSAYATYIYLNDGNGNYSDSGNSFSGVSEGEVHMADLDGDGDPDMLLTGNGYSGNTYSTTLLMNDGNGKFYHSNQSFTALRYASADIADVDNDGDLDIFIAGYSPSSIARLYLNNGAGEFSLSSESFTGAYYSASKFGDIDGDGDQDLIYMGHNGSAYATYVNFNNGLGEFSESTNSITPLQYASIDLGDIDGDGDLDLMVVGNNSSKVYVNNGNGVFTPSGVSLLGVTEADAKFGDADADGDLDIFVTGLTGSTYTSIFYENAERPFLISEVRPATAAPGSKVTLYGSGFSSTANDNTVSIGGSSATVISASSTQLLVTVPSVEAGAADVSVTNDNGTVDYSGVFSVLGTKEPYLKKKTDIPFDGVRYASSDRGDVDGDGNLDIIISGYNSSSQPIMELYLGDGDGGFEESGESFTGIYNGAIRFADLDGDDDLDIVASGYTGSAYITFIYFNDGDGGYDVDSNTYHGVDEDVDLGDVDGDGDIDMLLTGTGSAGTYTTLLYLNDGSGEFFNSGQSLLGLRYSSADMADADEDGDLDIVMAGYSPSTVMRLYLNDGAGNFTNSSESFTGQYYSDVKFADIDGDGDQDIISTGNTGSVVATFIHTNNGSGDYTSVQTSLYAAAYPELSVGDIDGDGDLDMLIAAGGNTRLYSNDGTGTFSESGISFTGVYDSALEMDDMDGDGDMDILITGYSGSVYESSYYENTEKPFLITSVRPLSATVGSKITIHGSGFSSTASENVVKIGGTTATINSASKSQLVVTVPSLSAGSKDIEVTKGGSTTSYENLFSVLEYKEPYIRKKVDAELEGVRYASSDLGDANGDGYLDMIISGYNASSETVTNLYLGDGEGGFELSEETFVGTYQGAVRFGDLDADGDLDVIEMGHDGSTNITRTYFNDGDGGYTVSGTTFAGAYQGEFELGDVDADGDLDMVLMGYGYSGTYSAAILLNDGGGSFFNSGQSLTGLRYGKMDMADADGDGDLDIIMSGYSPTYSVLLWLNDGAGIFSNSNESFTGMLYSDVIFVDLDGDGDQDVVSSGYNGSQYLTYLNFNNGSGEYTAASETLTGVQYATISAGDIDGDGDQDLIIAGNNTAVLYYNFGDGTFEQSSVNLTGVYDATVNMADLEGDGDVDILIAGYAGSTFSATIYENTIPPFLISKFYPLSGGAGTTLTIYGTKFSSNPSDNQVEIGGVSATVTAASENKLVVTVPSAAFPGFNELTVTNENGTAIASKEFDVLFENTPELRLSNVSLEGARYSSFDFADIDGDSDLDLFLTGQSSNGTYLGYLYLNGGRGNFVYKNSGLPNSYYGTPLFEDVDNDGDVDLLNTGYNGSYFAQIRLNNGDGTFISSNNGLAGTYINSSSFGDVDGDGDLDLFICGYATSAYLYINDGAGIYSNSGQSFQGMQYCSSSFFDFDNDGDLDLIESGNYSSAYSVFMYENDGEGTYTNISHNITGTAYGSISTGDVTGDGFEDIIISGYSNALTGGSETALYTNTGSGTFTKSSQDFLDVYDSSTDLGDFDGDGDLDLIVTGRNQSGQPELAIYFNNGFGSFTYAEELSLSIYSTYDGEVKFVDTDGDGDLDIAISGYSQSAPTSYFAGIYENLGGSSITKVTPSSGAPGTRISIFGSGFSSTASSNRVIIGDTEAEIISASSTKIVAEIPDVDPGFSTIGVVGSSGYARYGGSFSVLAEKDAFFNPSFTTVTALKNGSSVFGDVDGDGDMDLHLSGNNGSSNQSKLFLNNGAGIFSDAGVSFINLTNSAADFGDLDDDGDLDLVLAGYNGTAQYVFTYGNDGSGQFSTLSNWGGTYFGDVKIGYINSDSYPDILLTGNSNSGAFSNIYFSDGNGSFSSDMYLNAFENSSYAIDDIDNDGYFDVLISGFDGTVYTTQLFTGTGEEDLDQVSFNFEGTYNNRSHIADFDGDGDLDILISGSTVYLNNGSGTSFTKLDIDIDQLDEGDSAVGDFDGDGDVDVIITGYNGSDPVTKLYLNNGDGSFSDSGLSLINLAEGSTDVADIDADGDLDIILTGADTDGNPVSIIYENAEPPFGIADVKPLSGAPGSRIELYGAGFSETASSNTVRFGTETADVVSASPTKLVVEVPDMEEGFEAVSINVSGNQDGYAQNFTILRPEQAYFNGTANTIATVSGQNFGGLTTADLNNDGFIDAVITSSNLDKVIWYKSNGDGTFATGVEITTEADGPSSVFAADLNGDGNIDLLTSSLSDSEIAWYENDGEEEPSFTRTIITSSASGAQKVIAADLDGDGDQDVISASQSDDKVAWYENNGNGQFSDPVIITTAADGSWDIDAIDFDGDGYQDIVSASISDGKISWYPNGGEGVARMSRFQTKNDIATLALPRGVAVADLNGDERIDILATSNTNDDVLWFQNTGSSFSSAQTVNDNIDGAYRIATGDMDGDGDPDLVISANASSSVYWVENTENGFSISRTIYSGSTAIDNISLADIDLDGDLDVLATTTTGYSLLWFENQGPPKPENLDFETTSNSIQLSWTMEPSFNASGYNIYRSNDPGTDIESATKLNSSLIDTTYYVDTNVSPNTQYYYQITAVENGTSIETEPSAELRVPFQYTRILTANSFSMVEGDTVRVYAAYISGSASVSATLVPVDGSNSGSSTSIKGFSSSYIDFIAPDVSPGRYDLVVSISGTEHTIPGFTVLEVDRGYFRDMLEMTSIPEKTADFTVGDFNGDGYPDVGYIAYGDEASIGWLRNRGNTQFTQAQIILSPVQSGSSDAGNLIYSTDMDGDGYDDIVYTVRSLASAYWIKSEGDGTFGDPIRIADTLGVPAGIAVFDADSDGDHDVIITDEDGDRLLFIKNRGDNVFRNPVVIESGSTNMNGPVDVISGDMNKDGRLDIVVAVEGTDDIVYYVNNGNGTFGARQAISTSSNAPNRLAAVDIDKDGDTDLIATSLGADDILKFTNNGSGSFSSSIVSTKVNNPLPIAVDDITGDGIKDVITSNDNTGLIYSLSNTSGSGFEDPVSVLGIDFESSKLLLADIDQDGDLDLFSLNENNVYGKITAHVNFDPPPAPPTGLAVNGRIGRAELSWDANSEDDLNEYHLYRSTHPDSVYTQIATIAESSTSYTDADLENAYTYYYLVRAVDDSESESENSNIVNEMIFTPKITRIEPASSAAGKEITLFGNGFVDNTSQISVTFDGNSAGIISADSSFLKVEIPDNLYGKSVLELSVEGVEYTYPVSYLILASTDGTFSTPAEFSIGSSLGSLANADLDNDGFDDLLTTYPSALAVNYLLNDGIGEYGSESTLTTSTGSYTKIIQANLFDDGYPDLVAITNSNNEFHVFRNTGQNESDPASRYERTRITGSNVAATDIQVADMNNDGKQDVLISSSGDEKISIYLNQSLGQVSFSSEIVLSNNATDVNSIYPVDLNGDGLMDVIASETGATRISIYMNNGNNTFTKSTVASSVSNVRKVSSFDVNNDGDFDIVSISSGSFGQLVYYSGNGDGSFSSASQLASGIDGFTFQQGDLNGDGLVDLIVAESNGSLHQYMNTGSSGFTDVETSLEQTTGFRDMVLFDADNDGDLELALRSSTNAAIFVYYNLVVTPVHISHINIEGANNLIAYKGDGAYLEFVFDVSSNSFFNDRITTRFPSGSVTITDEDNVTTTASSNFNVFTDSSLIVRPSFLYTNESFTVTLNSADLSAASRGEFYLDTNGNGQDDGETDNYTSDSYSTSMLGDFDISGQVEFDDWMVLRDAWLSNDYAYELAPFTGKSGVGFPKVRVNGNLDFDIDDLSNFIRSWNHSQQVNSKILFDRGDEGKTFVKAVKPDSISFSKESYIVVNQSSESDYSADGNDMFLHYHISLDHPGKVKGLSLELEYDSDKLEVDNIRDLKLFDIEGAYNVTLTYADSLNGIAKIQVANFGEINTVRGRDIAEITFRVKDPGSSDVDITSDIRLENVTTPVRTAMKTAVDLSDIIPETFSLAQNYPNPFNPTTTIQYDLASKAQVNITIFDVLGRKVATLVDGNQNPGYYKVKWDAKALASGMYLYIIKAKSDSGENFTSVKKMILVK